MTFLEALMYAQQRETVLPDDFYLMKQYGETATISGLASISQIQHIMDGVNKAISEGSTFKDFQRLVESADFEVALPKGRLETIFRTNLQKAYNAGRYAQQKSVASVRMYWMYDAVNDDRTRPSHRALDGIILRHDNPWWLTHYPCLGFNCRCAVRSLTQKQAELRGITDENALPNVSFDDGFSNDPSDVMSDLGKLLPPALERLERTTKASSAAISKIGVDVGISVKAVRILNALNPTINPSSIDAITNALAPKLKSVVQPQTLAILDNQFINTPNSGIPSGVNELLSLTNPTPEQKLAISLIKADLRDIEAVIPSPSPQLYFPLSAYGVEVGQEIQLSKITNAGRKQPAAREVVKIINARKIGINVAALGNPSYLTVADALLIPDTKLTVIAVDITHDEQGAATTVISVEAEKNKK